MAEQTHPEVATPAPQIGVPVQTSSDVTLIQAPPPHPLEVYRRTHQRAGDEIASMQVNPDDGTDTGPTTERTENDKLSWVTFHAGDVEKIRESEHWSLLLKVLKAWKNPDKTSEHSCLLPEYEGFREIEKRQVGRPVPIPDEVFERAVLKWFGGKTSVRRKVLVVRTSHRQFWVELRCPNDPYQPSKGRHPEVVCSLDGQTTDCQQVYRRLVFVGPEMEEGTRYHRKDSKDRRWIGERDISRARAIYDGNRAQEIEPDKDSAKLTAAGIVKEIPAPRMLERRFWTAPSD